MNANVAASSAMETSAVTGSVTLAAVWNRFWFTPADGRPLALLRIGTASLAIVLWWSYAPDVLSWFGPAGILPADAVQQWRSPAGFSLFDAATTSASLRVLFGITGIAFAALLVGLGTPVVAPVAALLWASLLHRGPMLVGPADDCLAVLLWCLAIGPAGQHISVDGWLRDRAGRPAPGPTLRAGITWGLLQVHASAIAAAAVLSQLKGDVWWNGSAAWFLAARPAGRLLDLTPLLVRSEYLTNFVTHGVTAFEIFYAIGLWCMPTQRLVARVGLVAWPLIGVLAGEPWWGIAMGLFTVPLAFRR